MSTGDVRMKLLATNKDDNHSMKRNIASNPTPNLILVQFNPLANALYIIHCIGFHSYYYQYYSIGLCTPHLEQRTSSSIIMMDAILTDARSALSVKQSNLCVEEIMFGYACGTI